MFLSGNTARRAAAVGYIWIEISYFAFEFEALFTCATIKEQLTVNLIQPLREHESEVLTRR